MRLIDAESLAEGLKLHYKYTDQEYETDRAWSVGYNAGLDRALYSIAYAKNINPLSNDPLTLEELQGLEKGEPLWVEGIRLHGEYVLLLSNDGEVYRFVDTCEEILEAKEEDYGCEWTAYRRKPEEGTI